MQITSLQAIHQREQLIAELNQLMARHQIPCSLSQADLTLTDRVVVDSDRDNPKLSRAIIDSVWPSISSQSVYHFTTFEKAEEILKTGKFRLTNITKRYGEHEISSFCEAQGLLGYLEKDSSGKPVYQSLIMQNTYYASFASTSISNEDEEVLWRRFAPCNGVRFTFNVSANNPNFRKVHYSSEKGGDISLLREVSELIERIVNRRFLFVGISRLCAFYLPLELYEEENELRILHRLWDGDSPDGTDSLGNAFLEIKLNEMSKYGYSIEITDVMANTRPYIPRGITFTRRSA